jgi:uncharacterized membrane protein
LISWGLRLVCLEEVPPGWRDDELINIHALSNQLLSGQFPLYYPGASGHEPLYHHLHAGVHALLGFNVLSGHILSVMFGTLSVALTYSLVRRLFPSFRLTAVIACLMLATSFWSLMYSRTAIRHISLPPFVLATIYAFWRQIKSEKSTLLGWGLTGLLLGMTLYTYTASRLLPVLVLVFGGYLALFHPDRFRRHWVGYTLALGLTVLLVAPLGIVIAQNRSEEAREGIGADARVTQLARPVRALREGDPGPIISSTVKTLGMFHASGDPEWLYNIPGRPVFNLLGGVLLWSGVALCLYRWRNPRYFLLVPWLALGLSPAFISTPPASLSHTIMAQPVVYILPAVALSEIRRTIVSRVRSTNQLSPTLVAFWAVMFLFVLTNGVRDLRNYFSTWPGEEMVRILYRADYRGTAGYADAHPEITDLAVTSSLLGPWDRLALDLDTERDGVIFRLFDPGRALTWSGDQERSSVVLTTWPRPNAEISSILDSHTVSSETVASGLRLLSVSSVDALDTASSDVCSLGSTDSDNRQYRFDNGLELTEACWLNGVADASDTEMIVFTAWAVVTPLDLPPMPIVANPPPPGTYTGPRLAVFAHLLAPNAHAAGLDHSSKPAIQDDGLWVDPLTLSLGDRFIQIHRFEIDRTTATGPYTVKLGLYDPMTGEKHTILDAVGNPVADHIIIGGNDQS